MSSQDSIDNKQFLEKSLKIVSFIEISELYEEIQLPLSSVVLIKTNLQAKICAVDFSKYKFPSSISFEILL